MLTIIKSVGILLICGGLAFHRMGTPLLQSENIDLVVDENMPGAVMRKSLGGLQVLVANFFWIKRESHWEKKELNATLLAMEMAIQVNPRNIHYWLHGARTIAFDMPDWRIGKLYTEDKALPMALMDEIYEEQAKEAIKWLDKAALIFGDNYRIHLEKAQIFKQALDSDEKALPHYKKATEFPDCPYIVHRVYAETLIRTGLLKDGLEYYMKHYESLPEDDPFALREVVADRIRELRNKIQE